MRSMGRFVRVARRNRLSSSGAIRADQHRAHTYIEPMRVGETRSLIAPSPQSDSSAVLSTNHEAAGGCNSRACSLPLVLRKSALRPPGALFLGDSLATIMFAGLQVPTATCASSSRSLRVRARAREDVRPGQPCSRAACAPRVASTTPAAGRSVAAARRSRRARQPRDLAL